MFTRLIQHLQMRRSTAALLARADDRMLDDIGLTRAELEAMVMGLRPAAAPKVQPGWALPVLNRV